MISSKPNYLSKALPLNTITLRVEVLIYKFWEDTNIQSIRLCASHVFVNSHTKPIGLRIFNIPFIIEYEEIEAEKSSNLF